jgi:hypothetical protein
MAISSVGGVSQLSGYQRVGATSSQLSPEQQQQVNRLKAIDRKVHAHEQAHMAAGAGLTGGASFEYTRGPDGRQYAVAGEVRINLSSAQTPEASIERARQIQAAALAPADPSPQDRAVAAAAALMESQARAELSRMKRAEQGGESGTILASASQQAAGLLAYAMQDAVPQQSRIDQYA